jgi:hypothetical protein
MMAIWRADPAPERPKPKRKRPQARAAARRVRRAKMAVKDGGFQASESIMKSRKQKHTGCCLSEWCNARKYAPADAAYHRTFFRDLNDSDKRHYIGARLRSKHGHDGEDPTFGAHNKLYYLDSPSTLRTGSQICLQPSSTRRVCCRYFVYMCNTSNTLINQPFREETKFNPAYNGGQERTQRTTPQKIRGAVLWLLALAALYQQDPTSDHIYMPFANKQVIYKAYWDDRTDEEEAQFYTAGHVRERERERERERKRLVQSLTRTNM